MDFTAKTETWSLTLPFAEVAAAVRPIKGEVVSGDGFAVVVPDGDESVLLAVVDGLGHGAAAAESATIALQAVRQYPTEPLPELFKLCHERLKRLRGACAAMARIDLSAGTLTWASVGNVEGVCWRSDGSRVSIPQQGGILGTVLPAVRNVEIPIDGNETLILATDGIRSAFVGHRALGPPLAVAEAILGEHGKIEDDALVLVARLTGGPLSP